MKHQRSQTLLVRLGNWRATSARRSFHCNWVVDSTTARKVLKPTELFSSGSASPPWRRLSITWLSAAMSAKGRRDPLSGPPSLAILVGTGTQGTQTTSAKAGSVRSADSRAAASRRYRGEGDSRQRRAIESPRGQLRATSHRRIAFNTRLCRVCARHESLLRYAPWSACSSLSSNIALSVRESSRYAGSSTAK